MQNYEPLESPHRSRLSTVLWLVLWAAAGVLEGFVLVKCLIPYPQVLADQFIFRNFVVLKMFIGAVGSSMVVQAVMAWLSPQSFQESRTHGKHSTGLGRTVLGLAILGAGMAIAGNGPTMVAPAIGCGVRTAPWLIAGGLLAVLVNGVLDELSLRWNWPSMSSKPAGDARRLEDILSKLLGCTISYATLAMTAGLLMLAADVALELIVDFRMDVAKYGWPLDTAFSGSFLEYPAWPPTLAGLAVGLGQVPVRAVSNAGMGGSGALVTIIATLTCDRLFPGRSLQASYQKGFSSHQLVFNFLFVLAGAYLAGLTAGTADLGHAPKPLTEGLSPARMAAGAFLAMAGARIAGGCTCGHGVSGTSELSTDSWVGAMAIFGAAIATRCAMVYGLGINP